MTFAERALYHQIHPAKVFTDIATAIIAIDLFWRHSLIPGLIVTFVPPILVSAVLLREADLERYRRSPMGAYLRRFMPPWMQALRLFGALVMLYSAWYHVPAGVVGGLAIVAACWANGIVREVVTSRRGPAPHGPWEPRRK